jgi:NTE family protein
MTNTKLFLLISALSLSWTLNCGSSPASAAPKLADGKVQLGTSNLSRPNDEKQDLSSKITTPRPHLILALGGGGSKAVAQIGVLRSLEKHHIRIDGVVGSSMGAAIGALYCAGKSPDEIEQMWLDGTIPHALFKNIPLKIALSPVGKLLHVAGHKPYAGLTDEKSFLKLLEKNLPESFDQLRIPFAAIATNLTDGRSTVLSTGNLPKAIMASSAFPRMVRPVEIDGKVYADGGIKANLPARIAQSAMDADVVVAIPVDQSIKPVKNKKFTKMNNIISRITDIMIAALDADQAKSSDILIYPNMDSIPLITSKPAQLKKGIEIGEEAADQKIAAIAQSLVAAQNDLKTNRASAATGLPR